MRNVIRAATLACCLAAMLPLAALAGPPDEPRVIEDIPALGHPGGQLKTLIGRARDTRLLYVYGYSRLVNYNLKLQLEPDILAGIEVEGGRSFTMHLRKGHRWSDGQPFTTEDFRFWWEDVAQNPELMPSGPPIQLVVDGQLPKVEIVDERTVRYSWEKPNPFFLPSLAGPSPVLIYLPAHYLKQFHKKFADPDQLAALIKQTQSRDWAQLWDRKERASRFDNPDEPTLEPWQITNAPPAERFVAVRNPYFHRVDSTGQQLPYLDQIVLDVVDNKLVPIKTGAGETDIQARGLYFKDYTFLKDSEKRSNLRTLLWKEARAAHLAIYPNLNASDDAWRAIFRDIRFRKALSLGVDRDAINQYLYFGLAAPANNTVIEESPLYSEKVANACLGHDVKEANRLLDEMGLKGGPSGRTLPDGRPLELVVETAGEDTEQSDVLELVRDAWAQIGFKIHTKPADREVLRNRVFSGEALMTIFYGWDNGVPSADMPPSNFAPVSQYDQPMWPKWGQYYETKGKAGEAPDMPAAKQLFDLYQQWAASTTTEEREDIWHRILDTYAPECYTIGLIGDVMQPVAVRQGLMNVPEEAVFNWEPHGQFGIYRPDTWWWKK